ncbi:unnamed protein product, partial [Amoebophrya sp. A25]
NGHGDEGYNITAVGGQNSASSSRCALPTALLDSYYNNIDRLNPDNVDEPEVIDLVSQSESQGSLAQSQRPRADSSVLFWSDSSSQSLEQNAPKESDVAPVSSVSRRELEESGRGDLEEPRNIEERLRRLFGS